MIYCCNKCPDRHIGCHGKCEKYIAENKKHKDYLKKKREESEIANYIYSRNGDYLDSKTNSHRKSFRNR